MSVWDQLAATYLALPFDRVLDPDEARAEERAERYLAAAGIECPPSERALIRGLYDWLLSDYGLELAPPFGLQGAAELRHPLSGRPFAIEMPAPDPDRVCGVIRDLVGRHDDPKKRALALWRLLPERLGQLSPAYRSLPADARLPSLGLWSALDSCAGILAAYALLRQEGDEQEESDDGADQSQSEDAQGSNQREDGNEGDGRAVELLNNLRIVLLTVRGVQRYLASSRTVRDLWSASMLSAWMLFERVCGLVDMVGPAAVISPALRGNPWVDHWLRTSAGLTDVAEPSADALRVSALPNTAVFVGPVESLLAVFGRQPKWGDLWDQLGKHWEPHLPPEFRGRWDEFFEQPCDPWPLTSANLRLRRLVDVTRSAKVLWGDAEDEIPCRALRQRLDNAEIVRPEVTEALYSLRTGWWLDGLHVVFQEAQNTPALRLCGGGILVAPPKCTLCGVDSQIGPRDYDESRRFWQHLQAAPPPKGIRLNRRDRLCAPDLLKRYAQLFFQERLGLDGEPSRIPDVATIAARPWLRRARELGYALDPEQSWQRYGYWSGEWLHWPTPNFDPDEPACPEELFQEIVRARSDERLGMPPLYYAILKADGDELGLWLQGVRGPRTEQLVHESVIEQLQKDELGRQGLQEPAPLTAPMHNALSQALSNYAVHAVLPTVPEHDGFLVYAGGDDTLVLLPTTSAASCAAALRRGFSAELFGDGQIGPGEAMTLSAGIAFVHHKQPLRAALAAARQAEQYAKANGRDLLAVAVCRRSGEWTQACCPWPFVPTFQHWLAAFAGGASDRWVHHTAALLDSLSAAGSDAFLAELKRQLNRSSEATIERFGGGEAISQNFSAFAQAFRSRRPELPEQVLCREFTTLLQTASFLCRTTAGAME